MAADVGAISALIQPLGLFRKRAAAIQQLSHDFLFKQASAAGGAGDGGGGALVGQD